MAKKALYVVSAESLSGKSIVTLSLALMAKDLGMKVGYFKPIGIESALGPKNDPLDEDAETAKKALGLQIETGLICPVVLRKTEFLEDFNQSDAAGYYKRIVASYKKVSEDSDIVLIEGPPSLSTGAFLDCSVPRLAKSLGAEILLVARFTDDYVVDEVLQAVDCCAKWGVPLVGVVFNRVPRDKIGKVQDTIKPLLEAKGVKILGLIPEDKVLGALTVGEVYEATDGRILAGKEGMDRMIQAVLVGAMTPESAVRYFRKARNELVITGGDRTDIIFAALEAGASALILTGNLYPSIKVFPRADDLNVPIILVPHDTYTTLQAIQRIVGRIKPEDKKRINIAKRLVKEHTDWKQILHIGP